jgi:hypothetical protein
MSVATEKDEHAPAWDSASGAAQRAAIARCSARKKAGAVNRSACQITKKV